MSKELKASGKFTIKQNSGSVYTSYMCQSPMYFMYQLAIVLSGVIYDGIDFAVDDVAKRYEDAKWELIEKRNYIKHPHFADSYIILSE